MSYKHLHPAIIVVAYNRTESLRRILYSLTESDYTGYEDIHLVISIDYSPLYKEVKEIADNFTWTYGSKKVIQHQENLGLKSHILACGDLTNEYGSVIVLEDDLFVSPAFYDYTVQALNFYEENSDVAGISLYSYDFNEYAKAKFIPLMDNYDNYFLQSATSWGQAWSQKQWSDFKTWYNHNKTISQDDPLPDTVIGWKETSWKKNYIKYVVINNKYFVVPRVSLTTNFSDIGTHAKRQVYNYQVPLLLKRKKFYFSQILESISVYDSYYEINPYILKQFNIFLRDFDFECDFYGTKNLNKVKSSWLLTVREVSQKPLASYSLDILPQELNVILRTKGGFFNFSQIENVKKFPVLKKLSYFTKTTSDAGARKFGMLSIYDVMKRFI